MNRTKVGVFYYASIGFNFFLVLIYGEWLEGSMSVVKGGAMDIVFEHFTILAQSFKRFITRKVINEEREDWRHSLSKPKLLLLMKTNFYLVGQISSNFVPIFFHRVNGYRYLYNRFII